MKQCFVLGTSKTVKWSVSIAFTLVFFLYILQYNRDNIRSAVNSTPLFSPKEFIVLSGIEGNASFCELPKKNKYKKSLKSYKKHLEGIHDVHSSSRTDKKANTNHQPVNDSDSDSDSDREVHNVVFAKVHKAASTTMLNIMLRFAVSRKLNAMIPKKGHLINEGYFKINQQTVMPIPRGEHYNVLSNHLIFNDKEIKRFFSESTKFIGIVREPFAQFTSAFFFYALVYNDPRYMRAITDHRLNPIRGFLSQPQLYDSVPANNSYTNNRMSVDFGFPVEDVEKAKHDPEKIKKFVDYIDEKFDLILVVEMFDESLILLRRMFNWTTKDILYTKTNTRQNHADWSPRFLSRSTKDPERALHQQWAPIDYALYKRFSGKLLEMIKQQPIDFREELVSFQENRNRVKEFCDRILTEYSQNFKGGIGINATRWSPGFCITFEDCRLLFMNEMDMTHVARVWQKKKMTTAVKRPHKNV